eukprot:TRINITY_DN889_c0_g1_i2.p1 TRINITY_DN889_c0_g1~~TRINITY_DN889_c0_g1_i2.p1  ORF type:complete len:295 (+),score=52.14 TRINITY_DN889_c0_g1_i2:126-1010(+)
MAESSQALVPLAVPSEEQAPLSGDVSGGDRGREYRKGNWTLQETMILISAKKLDDERRLKGGDKEKSKTAEFRWKWVENYCWKNDCQRSQNQCNDKWDNLLRDYKKVREHESKLMLGQKSYWQLEKHERKERSLPSNLSTQVYEALHDIIDKRHHTPKLTHSGGTAGTTPVPMQALPAPSDHHQPVSDGDDSSENDDSGGVHPSPAKKRKYTPSSDGIGPALSKSTSELSQTLLACEEMKEKRHKDLLAVEERKVHIEEAKTEISRQGINGLIEAVNNLAHAILTLASDRAGGS